VVKLPSDRLNPDEYRALLRRDLVSFAQGCFSELNPRTRFAMSWHIEIIAAKLTALRGGKIRRLVINLPPRHLKSLLASVAFPAWCLGHDPSAQILCVSYAQDLADKLSRDCRHILASDWYRGIFPTRLSPQRAAMPEFDTTAQGCRLATSVGGVLTGRGADIVIIDDPLKPEEALSQAQRQMANEWYDHTLYSRLNDKLAGAIVVIMHRLHEDDLVGHVLAQEEWEIVRFPAIAEDDESQLVDTLFGPLNFTRRRGEALHPEREPRAVLEHIRRTIGEYNFAGQYQQAPAPLGGGLVKAAWFRRYTPDELPAALRAHHAELGHRQQGDRAQRFQRVHELGRRGQEPLPDRRLAPAHGISRIEARRARALRALRSLGRTDRGQGLGHAIDPGIDRRRPPRRHQLPTAVGQNHAPARADRNDRERLRAPARKSAVARPIPARADVIPQRQARRPGRLDRPDARLVQASRRRPRLPRRDVAFV
jgi:hypothetical protein